MSRGAAPYPEAAAAWMVGRSNGSAILDLGSGDGSFRQPCCTDLGHEVFCLDRDVDRVAGLPERLGTRLHVAGQVESLPYPVLPLRRWSPPQPRCTGSPRDWR